MRLAIFDFDETVVGFKTMFRFLAYADPDHAAVISEMQDMNARGISRATVNRYYYRRFAGLTPLQLANRANAWFEQEKRHGLPLITWTCAEITRRRALGDLIVVITGSFPEAIAPFRSLLGIDEVIAANLEVIDGKFTGDLVGDPVIGEGKAKALVKYATKVGAELSECSAYGDHGSDVAMLSLVKEAIAVNPCPQLRAHAVACGWAIVEASDCRSTAQEGNQNSPQDLYGIWTVGACGNQYHAECGSGPSYLPANSPLACTAVAGPGNSTCKTAADCANLQQF